MDSKGLRTEHHVAPVWGASGGGAQQQPGEPSAWDDFLNDTGFGDGDEDDGWGAMDEPSAAPQQQQAAAAPAASGGGMDLSAAEVAGGGDALAFKDFFGGDGGAEGGAAGKAGALLPAPLATGDAGAAAAAGGGSTIRRSGRGSAKPPRTGTARFWNVRYYQPYFNVDTSDVAARVRMAVMPFAGKTIFDLNPDADLYGPFWTCATLVLTVFVVSNLSSFISHDGGVTKRQWEYDFETLVSGGSVIFGYVGGVGALMWAALQYLAEDAHAKLVDMWCIYGYSFVLMVPVSAICVVPSESLRWTLIVGTFAYSAFFLVKNIQVHTQLSVHAPAKANAISAGAGAAHLLLALYFKTYYFAY